MTRYTHGNELLAVWQHCEHRTRAPAGRPLDLEIRQASSAFQRAACSSARHQGDRIRDAPRGTEQRRPSGRRPGDLSMPLRAPCQQQTGAERLEETRGKAESSTACRWLFACTRISFLLCQHILCSGAFGVLAALPCWPCDEIRLVSMRRGLARWQPSQQPEAALFSVPDSLRCT